MEETVTVKSLEWEECVCLGRSSHETGVAAMGSGERMRGIERKERKGKRRQKNGQRGCRAEGTGHRACERAYRG